MTQGERGRWVVHQLDGVGHINGTDTASWPWLYFFASRTVADRTTYTNKIGNSYRYRRSGVCP